MRYLLAISLVFSVACGTSDDDANHVAHANHDTDNSTHSEADTYADGMMKMGEIFHVSLMSATPGPPDVGDNTWILRIVDMDDNPIDDATVTLSPFMPAHGHGTSPTSFSGTFSSDGTYEVGPFDLFMPGTWETTVTVNPGTLETNSGTVVGDVQDAVTFTFELEG